MDNLNFLFPVQTCLTSPKAGEDISEAGCPFKTTASIGRTGNGLMKANRDKPGLNIEDLKLDICGSPRLD